MQGNQQSGGGRVSDTAHDSRRTLRSLLVTSPAARVRAARAAFSDHDWQVAYRRRLVVTDTIAVAAGVLVAYFLRWERFLEEPVRTNLHVPYVVLSLIVGLAWSISLVAGRTRDLRVMGSGPTEYHRVFDASWRLFAVLAVLAFLLRFPEARGYLAFAFPIGLGGLLLGRYAWRQWLHTQRAHGQVRRQRGVQPSLQLGQTASTGQCPRNAECRDLAGGMHPGIGSPGEPNSRRFADQPVKGLLELSLHGPSIRLDLRAGEGRPVVLEGRLHALLRRGGHRCVSVFCCGPVLVRRARSGPWSRRRPDAARA